MACTFSAMVIDKAHEQNQAERWWRGCGSDRESFSRAVLDGVRSWDGSSNWGVRSFIWEEKENRYPASWADTTCTDDIWDVKSMIYVLEDMGNLFSDDSGDLLVFDSQNLADPAVTETPPDWEARTRQYSIFVKQTSLSTKQKPTQIPSSWKSYPSSVCLQ